MVALARTAVVIMIVTSSLSAAQDEQRPETPATKIRPSDIPFEYDPRELHPEAHDGAPIWKGLLGPIGIGGFHIYPARQTGQNLGPPRTIWGNGFGTSMWRDPITGWPLQ